MGNRKLGLNNNGVLCFGIPSEGTVLWKLGYSLTTGLEFKKKYGLKYSTLMNYEHINKAKEIQEVCKYLFNDIKSNSFGLCNCLSLYQYYECRNPNLNRARELLSYYENNKLHQE